MAVFNVWKAWLRELEARFIGSQKEEEEEVPLGYC